MAIESVDMTGKQVMITGCTAGLGRAAAVSLAEMGATFSIVCRNRGKGEELAYGPQPAPISSLLDIMSLSGRKRGFEFPIRGHLNRAIQHPLHRLVSRRTD